MGKLSIATKNEVLNHIFNDPYGSGTAQCWIGLSTTDPATTTTPPGGDGYTRKEITFDAPVANSRKVIQAAGVISFPEVTNTIGGDWGVIGWYTIHSAETTGTLLAYGSFANTFNPVLGNTPTIPGATIEISIDPTTGGNAGFTDTAVDHILNMVFRNATWTQPGLFIGLQRSVANSGALITDAMLEAGLSEVAGSAYTRINVPRAGGWDASAVVATTTCGVDNTSVVTIGPPSANDWGEFGSLFLASAITGGELLAYDNSNIADQTPTVVDTIQIAAGQCKFQLN